MYVVDRLYTINNADICVISLRFIKVGGLNKWIQQGGLQLTESNQCRHKAKIKSSVPVFPASSQPILTAIGIENSQQSARFLTIDFVW